MKKSKIIANIIAIIMFLGLAFYISRDTFLLNYVLNSMRTEMLPEVAYYECKEAAFADELFPLLAYIETTDKEDNKNINNEKNVDKDTKYELASENGDETSIIASATDAVCKDNIGGVDVNEQNADMENVKSDIVTSETTTHESSVNETETEAAAVMSETINGPSPISYSMEQLYDFDTLISNCYLVDESTMLVPEEADAEKLLGMDMGIDVNSDDIKVLIYHTHGSETFADSREGEIEDTVIGVGDELARILEEDYGIRVYHDRNIYDNVNGILDRSRAYALSGEAVDNILAENPSIEVILDIHRDGVRKELRMVRQVNGKDTAQIMFLNGVSRLKATGDIEYLNNPHKEENLSFSLKLFLNGRSMYGDLIRKIYIRGYSFNLEKMARASLVEVGAQTNTVEEAKNAMEPLARIIYSVLSE